VACISLCARCIRSLCVAMRYITVLPCCPRAFVPCGRGGSTHTGVRCGWLARITPVFPRLTNAAKTKYDVLLHAVATSVLCGFPHTLDSMICSSDKKNIMKVIVTSIKRINLIILHSMICSNDKKHKEGDCHK
jgi:hypothetical protein